MTDSGENHNDSNGSGPPDWWPRGYAWSLVLFLTGFMLGVVIMLWLAGRFGW